MERFKKERSAQAQLESLTYEELERLAQLAGERLQEAETAYDACRNDTIIIDIEMRKRLGLASPECGEVE